MAIRQRITDPDEIERMEERMDNYFKRKVEDESSFNYYYRELVNIDESDLTRKQIAFRRDVWLIYAANHGLEIMKKDVPELKREIRKGVSRDKRRKLVIVEAPKALPKLLGLTAAQKRRISKERKIVRKKVKARMAKERDSREVKKFMTVGYVKKRLVYGYPIKFKLYSKTVTRYKDRTGKFISLKKKRQ